MFADRNYRRRTDSSPDDAVKAIWFIILACALIFLLGRDDMILSMCLDAPDIRKMELWRLVTYMFLHANIGHIFFNMWGLYIFGKGVAIILGRKRFLSLYFISGIFGGLVWVAANWKSPYPVIGASGAVFGVMLAMAMLDPNQEYLILFLPVPIKCKTLIVVYALLEIISEYSGAKGNVAHLAHLGGFVGGYIFLKAFCSQYIKWDPLAFLSAGASRRQSSPPPGWGFAEDKNNDKKRDFDPRRPMDQNAKSFSSNNYRNEAVSPKEIDRLLDKISQSGINSLTADELANLRRAREQMKKQ